MVVHDEELTGLHLHHARIASALLSRVRLAGDLDCFRLRHLNWIGPGTAAVFTEPYSHRLGTAGAKRQDSILHDGQRWFHAVKPKGAGLGPGLSLVTGPRFIHHI